MPSMRSSVKPMSPRDKKTRVVFYTNCLGRGGGHQTFLAWFELLKPLGYFELKIFCHAEGWFSEQLRSRNLPYEILPMPRALAEIRHGSWKAKTRTLFRVASMTVGLLRSWARVAFIDADVVVLTGGRDFLMLFPLALRRRKQTVTIPQTTDWGEIPVCRMMCQVAAKTYAISQAVADSIIQMNISPAKVSVYPLIYTTDYLGLSWDRREIRESLGIPPFAAVLGMTGVIRPHKGQREAIMILAEVAQRIPNVKLIIVGAAPKDAPDAQAYELSLRQLIIQRGLQSQVLLLGWRDDVSRIMRAMDILLVPSHDFEGVPRVILEGLEASLPIVATDLPQFKEIIGRFDAGFLHPIDQLTRWADDIVGLLKDKSRLTAASQHARRVWETEYSCESVRPRIVSAFRELSVGV